MSVSKENIQMLFNIISNHMQQRYQYETTKQDLDLLIQILKQISFQTPKETREHPDKYKEKINKLTLDEFIKIRTQQSQQQLPSTSAQPPQQLQQHMSPSQIRQDAQEELSERYAPSEQSLPDTQSVISTSTDTLQQEREILQYERNQFKVTKEQMTKDLKLLMNKLEESERQNQLLQTKLQTTNTTYENKQSFVFTNTFATKKDNTFFFPIDVSNVYKIRLSSGLMESFNEFNIHELNCIFTIKQDNKEHSVKLEYGNYTLDEIISILENKLHEDEKNSFEFQSNSILNRVVLKNDTNFDIISTSLSTMLGFHENTKNKNLYVSDEFPKVCKNHVSYIQLKINNIVIKSLSSLNENINNAFGILYDHNEKNCYSLTETFEQTIELTNVKSISFSFFNDHKEYLTNDIKFTLKVDLLNTN